MIRITVDTNVLISATFWHGASEKIIDKVENKEVVLTLSEKIIEEYIKVLNYEEIQQKMKEKNLQIKEAMLRIGLIAEIVEVKTKIRVVKEDPEDDKIIECAVEGNVDYIISQDKHLLSIKKFQNIPIIHPQEFLKILNSP